MIRPTRETDAAIKATIIVAAISFGKPNIQVLALEGGRNSVTVQHVLPRIDPHHTYREKTKREAPELTILTVGTTLSLRIRKRKGTRQS
jgi:hypothetical protein